MSTFAGDGFGEGGVYGRLIDGFGTAASFDQPRGITVDMSDNIFVIEESHRVRKVTPAGAVTVLAGGSAGLSDGVGGSANFFNPRGAGAVDASGAIFVGD